MPKWELIQEGPTPNGGDFVREQTHRMRIPGGWLVKSTIFSTRACAVHTIFVADGRHDWSEKT
jgi:hypothetical protein